MQAVTVNYPNEQRSGKFGLASAGSEESAEKEGGFIEEQRPVGVLNSFDSRGEPAISGRPGARLDRSDPRAALRSRRTTLLAGADDIPRLSFRKS
jgi:hypothetical protein